MSLVPGLGHLGTGHRGFLCPRKLCVTAILPLPRQQLCGESNASPFSSRKEVFSTGSNTLLGVSTEETEGPLHSHIGKARHPFSFLERGEFIEGVPEQRRLPLGFCQGEDLLLRDAGGHGDMALVKGM